MRIDFYILNQPSEQARWHLACRVIEKAYHRGHRVFVLCDNQTDAEHLDELLWTYKEDSFIPHNLQGEGPEPPPPIQIGYGPEPRHFNDILLNMAAIIPDYIHRFKRGIEIVHADEAMRATSREHYRQYKSLGFELHSHPMD